ncbi:hypothetical protein MMC13_005330 [Lambiella insularis]|nr:hypothetical protein [Lambiella insularis]
MITVNVGMGEELESFPMHKELLEYHSSLFRKSLDACMKPENLGVVDLPTISPTLFRKFEVWLYNLGLDMDSESFSSLTDLYIFAESIGAVQLQNSTLEAMRDLVIDSKDNIPCHHAIIDKVWKHTGLDSPLRTFIVDVLAFEMSLEQCRLYASKFPWDTLIRLLEALMKRNPERSTDEDAPYELDMEQYYVKEGDLDD